MYLYVCVYILFILIVCILIVLGCNEKYFYMNTMKYSKKLWKPLVWSNSFSYRTRNWGAERWRIWPRSPSSLVAQRELEPGSSGCHLNGLSAVAMVSCLIKRLNQNTGPFCPWSRPPPPNRWPQQSCAGARAGRSAALGASQRLDSEQQQQHLREDAETEAWLHQARSWGRGLQAPRRQRGTEQETAGVSGEETCAVTGWSSGWRRQKDAHPMREKLMWTAGREEPDGKAKRHRDREWGDGHTSHFQSAGASSQYPASHPSAAPPRVWTTNSGPKEKGHSQGA